MYNYESGMAATGAVLIDDAATQSFLLFQPGSLFLLPSPPQALPKDHPPAPPKKPPQHLL
jgi:hypothetical protein